MTKPYVVVSINDKGYYKIEKPGVWWMVKPCSSPSGLMIILPDKTQHHYDVYDEKGHKLEDQRIKIEGYCEPNFLYARSGQNVYEIDPLSGPRIIPNYPGDITYFPSGSKTVVNSNAPGWLIVITKENG